MEIVRNKYSLDRSIKLIKEKGDREGFNYSDTRIILALELVRLEISILSRITNESLGAIKEIKAMTAYENYKSTHPHLYEYISNSLRSLSNYNENFYSADIDIVGLNHKSWVKYFRKSTKYLLDQIEPLHPKESEYRKKQLKRKGLQEGEE